MSTTATATRKRSTVARKENAQHTYDEVWSMLVQTTNALEAMRLRIEAETEAYNKRLEEEEKRREKEREEARKEREEDEKRREKEREEEEKRREEARKTREEDDKRRKAEEERRGAIIDMRLDRISKQIDKYTDSIGEQVELLMTPGLHRKFRSMGYTFETVSRDKIFKDSNGDPLTEVDVLLENGIYVMAVEVKTTLRFDDIKHHTERMAILRQCADIHGDNRKFIGAVAAPSVDDALKRAAYKAGFFVLEPSDEVVNVSVPDGFKPKEW